jgi:ABC-2 type transport system permease protein
VAVRGVIAVPEQKPAAPMAWTGSDVFTQILVLTARSLRATLLDRRVVLFMVLTPLLMLLVFSQIFATVASTPNFPRQVSYIEYLVPAFMVNFALQAAMHTGIALTEEIRNGIVARFRSLPIWLGSVLVARSLADLTRSALQLLALLVLAFTLFGFHPGGGVAGALAAWGLALVVGGGLGWLFIALACWIRNIELIQSSTILVTFPLLFASNAFVPLESLPGWLRVVAQVNPLTHGIDAARDLTLGEPVGTGVVVAVLMSFLVASVAMTLAVRGFRRPL